MKINYLFTSLFFIVTLCAMERPAMTKDTSDFSQKPIEQHKRELEAQKNNKKLPESNNKSPNRSQPKPEYDMPSTFGYARDEDGRRYYFIGTFRYY